jgi:hypothetical protein
MPLKIMRRIWSPSTPVGIPRKLMYVVAVALTILLIASPSHAASSQPLGEPTTRQSVASTSNAGDQPDAVCPSGGQCFTDVPSTNPFYAFVNRIYQQDLVTGYPCGGPGEPCDAQNRPYYSPINNVTRQQMAKFIDNARHLPGIDIEVSGGTVPIIAHNNTGTAIAAYSTSGQALTVQSGNQSAIYAQSGEAAVISAYSTGSTGASYGVYATGATGLYGGGTDGVAGAGSIVGVSGSSTSGTGVSGTSTSGSGVFGQSMSDPGVNGNSTNSYGVYGTSPNSYGVNGHSINSYGVYASSDNNDGLIATSNAHVGVIGQSTTGEGVDGDSQSSNGVAGISGTGYGVYGQSSHLAGVWGTSNSGDGVDGTSTSGYGVYGSSTGNYAGYFSGNVHVTGNCCAMGQGTTQIDDPLDPANKVLNQSVVASPDMLEVYRGHVTLDAAGSATVQLPAYFEALNRDFDYQLTPVGAPMPNLYIAQEVQGNSFKIAGGKPGGKVSWQVTGTRNDPYAQAHPIQPEQAKPTGEQGKYLYPAEYGQPASSGIDYTKQQQAQQVRKNP